MFLMSLGASVAACASLEHGIIDATTFENDLPTEVRNLSTVSRESLTTFGHPGVREFEIGRRFEAGSMGFPKDLPCALAFYDVAGQTPTRLREQTSPAVTQVVTYRGLGNARLAARRLRRDGVVAAPSPQVCLDRPGGGS